MTRVRLHLLNSCNVGRLWSAGENGLEFPRAFLLQESAEFFRRADRMFAAICRLFLRNSPRDDVGQQIEDLITLQMVDGSQWHH